MKALDELVIDDLQMYDGEEPLDWAMAPEIRRHLLEDRTEERSFREILVESEATCLPQWQPENRRSRVRKIAARRDRKEAA